MTEPVNRIKHLMREIANTSAEFNAITPAIDMMVLKKEFQRLQEKEEKVSQSKLEIQTDVDDGSYLEDKLDVARSPDSILTESRAIFQKDSKTGKVFLIAQLDEMDLPDDFSPDGDEMFMSDIIIRIFGKAYADPKRIIAPIDQRVFKKKNWRGSA